ncbi:MAG: hypothetical protein XE08_0332 [Parcubacteria bacterium 32_520]|nr:MAG: hypothetical protein XD75_0335 [Parcubacteria bacterium 33_209]KUK98920.1 MAG: hypothetical protein XE08_0332 [Parcubacteria bacterium 32_520]
MFKFKKLLLLVLIVAVAFSCFSPFETVNAFWSEAYDFVTDPVGTIATAIVSVITDIIASLCEFILNLGSQMLSWSITAGGIDQTGRGSPVVTEGWNLTRGLANSALIIGLVIIAINIILGKEEEQAKKTLINFVIVALLINFTPLICGFLIEGANIIARGFISEGITNEMSNQFLEGVTLARDGADLLEVLMLMIFLIVFSIISFFVYILYSLLFLARTVVLWILIVVSPIALATKVFPKSNAVRKFFPSILYWDDWYEMFLQWVIIVIPAAFFIHLSNIAIKTLVITKPPEEANDIISNGFSCSLPLIFLIVGFMVTISSGGKVASPIGDLGKKAWAATAGAAGGYAIGKAKAGASKVAEGAKAVGTLAKEEALGAVGAAAMGANPLKTSRDVGIAKTEEVKATVSGYGKRAKERVGIGEEYSWAKKKKEADDKLNADKIEFSGSNKEDVMAEYDLLTSRMKAMRKAEEITEKESEKMEEKLILAMINDKYFNSEDNEKGQEIIKKNEEKITEIVSGYTGQDAIKNLKPRALRLPAVAKGLGPQPRSYILNSNRSTSKHAVALTEGIATLSKEEQVKAVAEIGNKNPDVEGTVVKLDQLREKEKTEGLTDKEKEEAAKMAESLRKQENEKNK